MFFGKDQDLLHQPVNGIARRDHIPCMLTILYLEKPTALHRPLNACSLTFTCFLLEEFQTKLGHGAFRVLLVMHLLHRTAPESGACKSGRQIRRRKYSSIAVSLFHYSGILRSLTKAPDMPREMCGKHTWCTNLELPSPKIVPCRPSCPYSLLGHRSLYVDAATAHQ